MIPSVLISSSINDRNKNWDKDCPAKQSDKKTQACKLLPAWWHIQLADIDKPVVDREWTCHCCAKCEYHTTGQQGIFVLSHEDSTHEDDCMHKAAG
jgi:hypothetical protein